jgi:hypothetical protein
VDPELQQAQDFMLQSRHDIRYWNEATFGNKEQPWSKQWDIWESIRDYRRTVVKAGRGIGKSFIAARAALWFLYCYPGSLVITTAPTARQVDEILWKEIRTQYRLTHYDLGGKLYPGRAELKLDDDWKAIGFTTQKGDKDSKMSGYHAEFVLIIIDEAADSGLDRLFDDAENICVSEHSRILAIGNPIDPKSRFAKCFSEPAGNELAGWNKISISVLESPNVVAGKQIYPKMTSLEWVESCKRKWGEDSSMYRCNVLAEFPEEGEDTVIPLWAILAARKRTIEDIEEAGEIPKYNSLGVDVARYGNDMSIGYHLDGPYARKVFQLSKKDTYQVGQKISELNSERAFKRINVDDDGVGGGVTDHLRRVAKLRTVNRILSGGKSSNPKFLNKRTELIWKLKERFVDKQDIILEDEEVGIQLAAYRYEFVPKGDHGVYKLEEKKKTKKRLKRSPDDADALIYASEDKKTIDWSKCVHFT